MKTLFFMGPIGGTELIIILLIVLLLFGGRKIPQLAKDIGLGIKEFRKSLSGSEDTPQITHDEEQTEKKTQKEKKSTNKKHKT